MNVKELLEEQCTEEVAAVLAEKYQVKPEDRARAVQRLAEFIRSLEPREPVDTGHLILGIFRVDEDGEYLAACLFCKAEIGAEFRLDSELADLKTIEDLTDEELERLAHIRDFPQTYAFEFEIWNKILGYEVDLRNVRAVGATALCAEVLWEMTFCGMTEEAVEAERRKLDEALREAEEISKLPEKEKKKYFIPAEELFAEFDLPKPTEAEKRERHRRICREALTNNLRTWQAVKAYLAAP